MRCNYGCASKKYPRQVQGQQLKGYYFVEKKVIPLFKYLSVVSVSVFLEIQYASKNLPMEMQQRLVLTKGSCCKFLKPHPGHTDV